MYSSQPISRPVGYVNLMKSNRGHNPIGQCSASTQRIEACVVDPNRIQLDIIRYANKQKSCCVLVMRSRTDNGLQTPLNIYHIGSYSYSSNARMGPGFDQMLPLINLVLIYALDGTLYTAFIASLRDSYFQYQRFIVPGKLYYPPSYVYNSMLASTTAINRMVFTPILENKKE